MSQNEKLHVLDIQMQAILSLGVLDVCLVSVLLHKLVSHSLLPAHRSSELVAEAIVLFLDFAFVDRDDSLIFALFRIAASSCRLVGLLEGHPRYVALDFELDKLFHAVNLVAH